MKKRQPLTALEVIEKAQYPIITAPFFGAEVQIKIRELTHTQARACGDFSFIETFQDKINKKKMEDNFSIQKISEYVETMHNITRESLVNPTYEQIIEVVEYGPQIEIHKKELKEIEELLHKTPMGPKRKELQEEIYIHKAFIDYIFPYDFMNTIMCYALGIEKSDIKKVSEDMLLEAAILAERGHNNPADHLTGKFTDFMKEDINKRAWIILKEKRSKESNVNFRGLKRNGG